MTDLEAVEVMLKVAGLYVERDVDLEDQPRHRAIRGPDYWEAHDDDGVRYPCGTTLTITPTPDRRGNDTILHFDLAGKLVDVCGQGDRNKREAPEFYWKQREAELAALPDYNQGEHS